MNILQKALAETIRTGKKITLSGLEADQARKEMRHSVSKPDQHTVKLLNLNSIICD